MTYSFYKQCQSCGRQLEEGKNSGTEANGDKSLKYCDYCYQNGAFLQPDFTLEDMKAYVDKVLKEKKWIKPLRWLAVKQLPSLERWKNK